MFLLEVHLSFSGSAVVYIMEPKLLLTLEFLHTFCNISGFGLQVEFHVSHANLHGKMFQFRKLCLLKHLTTISQYFHIFIVFHDILFHHFQLLLILSGDIALGSKNVLGMYKSSKISNINSFDR